MKLIYNIYAVYPGKDGIFTCVSFENRYSADLYVKQKNQESDNNNGKYYVIETKLYNGLKEAFIDQNKEKKICSLCGKEIEDLNKAFVYTSSTEKWQHKSCYNWETTCEYGPSTCSRCGDKLKVNHDFDRNGEKIKGNPYCRDCNR